MRARCVRRQDDGRTWWHEAALASRRGRVYARSRGYAAVWERSCVYGRLYLGWSGASRLIYQRQQRLHPLDELLRQTARKRTCRERLW
eukprot:1774396-Pleurochrysis_carterae.AAC.1